MKRRVLLKDGICLGGGRGYSNLQKKAQIIFAGDSMMTIRIEWGHYTIHRFVIFEIYLLKYKANRMCDMEPQLKQDNANKILN